MAAPSGKQAAKAASGLLAQMTAPVRGAVEVLCDRAGVSGWRELWRSGMGLRVLLDGNLFTTVADPTRKGELVGEDHMGNRYYTNWDLPYVRSRWVIYKDKANYAVEQIPAEWHAWLNYINDFPPSQYQYKRPIYALEANKANDTKRGHQQAYNPKGNWHNPHQLSWLKYQPWQPPGDHRH